MSEAIDALPVKVQVVLDSQIERLALFGSDLGFPYTSQVVGDIRELRCHYGSDHFRILYARSGNLFVLLHLVAKRSATIPTQDIRIARARWDDFARRMAERPRRGPRAAGRDAP